MATRRAQKPIRTDIDDFTHDDFTVFTDVDLSPDKTKIASTYPLWMHNGVLQEVDSMIRFMRTAIENNYVAPAYLPQYREQLAYYEAKREQLLAGEPKFDGKARDFISKVLSSLGEKISNAMFTRTEVEKGLADAHEEARRMSEPVISLNSDELRWAKICNVKVVGTKVSRTSAELMWKIGRRILGESTNTKILQKD